MPQQIDIPGMGVVEFPDGMSDEQISSAIKSNMPKVETKKAESNAATGMPWYEKALVGFGGTLPGIYNRFQQMSDSPLALGGSNLPFNNKQETQQRVLEAQQRIDEAKKLEAPLGGWGTAGKIAGVAGLTAPLAPFSATLPGAVAVGSAVGALDPVSSDESATGNVVAGGLGGAAGYGIGKGLGKAANWAKQKVSDSLLRQSQNAARDATLSASREAGYVVPPSEVKPTAITNLLERFAGKASVAQKASIENQQVTNKLVRESLGLPKEAPITPETLAPVKQAAWDVYSQMKNLGTMTTDGNYNRALTAITKEHGGSLVKNSGVEDFVAALRKKNIPAEDAVNTIMQLRADANIHLSPNNTDPASRALGRAKKAAASALEDLIERNIAPGSGGKELLNSFRNARVTLAKVGTVEKAMIESTGDVSARKLSGDLAKGKPLSGGLRTAAEFAQAFPRSNQMNVNQIPGGSPLDMVAGIGTSAATGNPAWMALASGRPLARSAVLSSMFAKAPNYNPGVAKYVPGLLANPAIPPTLGFTGGLLGPYGLQ